MTCQTCRKNPLYRRNCNMQRHLGSWTGLWYWRCARKHIVYEEDLRG